MAKRKTSRRSEQELAFLFEVSQILAGSLDIREMLEPVLKTMASNLNMLRGTIALLNRETGEIQIEVAYGLSDRQQKLGRYRAGEGVTGMVVQTGKPAIVPRVSQEPLFLNRTGARGNLKKKDISFLCVPIKIGAETIGALSVDRLFGDQVSLEEDLRLLIIVAALVAQAVRLRQQIREERDRLMEENTRLESQLRAGFRPENLVGNSTEMQTVYDLVDQVSRSSATVLIRGESGTGKELVAHAIHLHSLRSRGPYIKVNCAALPENLIESELFGHEKGAFTGAVALRKGRFELASGGTIFLDEIGYLAPPTQVRLLRVLQEREIERVGGATTHKVDVRVIAATNRDLEEMMKTESFLPDLYYRLNVFPIHMPPLRERRSDILQLTDHFIAKYNDLHHKRVLRLSTPAIDMLMAYHWPGNVRELENCIERAVLLSDDEVIHGHYLPPSLQTAESSGTMHQGGLQAAMDNLERELLIDALKSSRGNRAKAARALGISERLIGLRVAKHGIDVRRFNLAR